MPRLTIRNQEGCREFEVGMDTSILDAALEASIALEHACGGQAQCSTCVVEVLDLGGNLTPVSKQEESFLMNSKERLSCQAKILGNVSVRIPSFRRKDARQDKRGSRKEGLLDDSLGRGGIGT